MEDTAPRRSRRQLLFGGLAAAAGAALARVATPEPVAAANGDPVVAGSTTIATAATNVLTTNGTGLLGRTDNHDFAGVAGLVGSGATLPTGLPLDAGVFGLGGGSGASTAGVWGDAEGVGVVGSGSWGVYGTGGVGVAGDAGPGATGVYGFIGDVPAPLPTPNVAVEARAIGTHRTALNVVGRMRMDRSGRTLFKPGQSVLVVNLAGVSSASLIMAVAQTYQSGVFVITAAPFTNKFVLRLSKAPTINYWVQWMVLN